jgi:hypothetical protein
VDLLTRV